MTDGLRTGVARRVLTAATFAAFTAGTLSLGGCAGAGLGDMAASQAPEPPKGAATASDLEKATEYWGKKYAENSRDGAAALNYAKNLKAMGRKKEALGVLQTVHPLNTQDREHLSEYGRLALELDQVSTAKQLLERADDPAKPDWRVLSARGTVLAKEGQYKDAIGFYQRALAIAPSQPSVLNNLAMAYAMEGEAAKAEGILRQAADVPESDTRVRQNLALVLGLQGKYGEAKTVAGREMSQENVQANIDYLKQVVRAEPQAEAPATRTAGWSKSVAPSTAEATKARKTTTAVSTSSINKDESEQLIEAALRAEASKNR
jgi:Flp pilus assembly protein TadD